VGAERAESWVLICVRKVGSVRVCEVEEGKKREIEAGSEGRPRL
jgi:hypothetical protein